MNKYAMITALVAAGSLRVNNASVNPTVISEMPVKKIDLKGLDEAILEDCCTITADLGGSQGYKIFKPLDYELVTNREPADAISDAQGNSPMPAQSPTGDSVALIPQRKRWGAKRQTADIEYDPTASRRIFLHGHPYRSVEKFVEIPYKGDFSPPVENICTKMDHSSIKMYHPMKEKHRYVCSRRR